MAERPKLLYVIVHDEIGENVDQDWSQRKRLPSSRYTRAALQSTLQFMGCKARHAFKISVRVFEVLRDVPPSKVFEYHGHPVEQEDFSREKEELSSFSLRKPPKASKKRSMVVISRDQFLDVVCDALAQYKYVGPNQRADLMLACRFRERKSSVTVLLCGTSGCGKSTLSSLLASRLGITTVVSTDSIRHMMRSFSDQKQNPLLWASTYHAGEFLDPVAVKEATARRKLSISASGSISLEEKEMMIPEPAAPVVASPEEKEKEKEKEQEQQQQDVSSRAMVVQGFKAQCEMVIDSLDRLITSWEQKNESVVVEGVHLSLNFVMGLMRKHPSIIPFMIYISNEEKHLERFAVRAKYMTLDPSKNKYAKYIRNIRTIQEYLCKRADKHLVPKINNTNVDKSVAGIHATIFSCLRRKESGEPLYDPATNTVKVVEQEFQNQYSASSSLGSKCMFQLIQRNGSSHHLMALMNVDGSVAKAWHIDSSSEDVGKLCSSGCSKARTGNVSPVYGPLRIGRTGPVHLQFGNFGLSAFPSEAGETSSSGGDGSSSSKVDSHELSNNNTSTSSRSSLSSSSPRHVEAEKEAVDETAVFVSAEDPEEDNFSVVDSDEELADENEEHLQEEEIEGSVSESSVRSDEELEFIEEGLADNEDGYWSEEEKKKSSEDKLLENEQELEEVQQRFEVAAAAAADEFSPRPEIDLFKVSPLHQKSTNIPPVVVVPCAKQLHSRTKSLPVLGALKG